MNALTWLQRLVARLSTNGQTYRQFQLTAKGESLIQSPEFKSEIEKRMQDPEFRRGYEAFALEQERLHHEQKPADSREGLTTGRG